MMSRNPGRDSQRGRSRSCDASRRRTGGGVGSGGVGSIGSCSPLRPVRLPGRPEAPRPVSAHHLGSTVSHGSKLDSSSHVHDVVSQFNARIGSGSPSPPPPSSLLSASGTRRRENRGRVRGGAGVVGGLYDIGLRSDAPPCFVTWQPTARERREGRRHPPTAEAAAAAAAAGYEMDGLSSPQARISHRGRAAVATPPSPSSPPQQQHRGAADWDDLLRSSEPSTARSDPEAAPQGFQQRGAGAPAPVASGRGAGGGGGDGSIGSVLVGLEQLQTTLNTRLSMCRATESPRQPPPPPQQRATSPARAERATAHACHSSYAAYPHRDAPGLHAGGSARGSSAGEMVAAAAAAAAGQTGVSPVSPPGVSEAALSPQQPLQRVSPPRPMRVGVTQEVEVGLPSYMLLPGGGGGGGGGDASFESHVSSHPRQPASRRTAASPPPPANTNASASLLSSSALSLPSGAPKGSPLFDSPPPPPQQAPLPPPAAAGGGGGGGGDQFLDLSGGAGEAAAAEAEEAAAVAAHHSTAPSPNFVPLAERFAQLRADLYA